MTATASCSSPWRRRWCAFLFWSGLVVAAVSIVCHGVGGMLVGYSLWALAWAGASRVDPSKWPR